MPFDFFSHPCFFRLFFFFSFVCCCLCRRFVCLFLVFFVLFFFFRCHFINRSREIWIPFLQQPQEQRYPFQPVCAVFSCVQTMVWLPVFGGLTCTEMLMHGIAHRHCTNTVAESALKRNRTGVSFAPGFLDPMLCQPNYVCLERRRQTRHWHQFITASPPRGSCSHKGQRCM